MPTEGPRTHLCKLIHKLARRRYLTPQKLRGRFRVNRFICLSWRAFFRICVSFFVLPFFLFSFFLFSFFSFFLRVGGFLAFVGGFYVGFCGFCGFSFRILCIHSSSLFVFVGSCGFCGFGFSHPLYCQLRCGRWLVGFVAFRGFLALAFRILCFPSWFLALASCILSIASSSLVPPATPLSIKMHAF